ncbi:adenine modification methytransferase [Pseudomonas sp. NY11382]|uniref:adenine modification methytransferase n=1 Tax=Pseudomonas sp. NY11382 TaxID=2939495 RepID=UPI00159F2A46
MADFMRRRTGKVMVNINDHPDIRRALNGFYLECLDIRCSNSSQRQAKFKLSSKLVILNWLSHELGQLFWP